MQAGFTITFDYPATRNVLCTLPDFFKWAREQGKAVSDINNAGLEAWFRVIWNADTRLGNTIDTFDDWASHIVDMDRLDDAAPKATPKAASKERSSNSKR